VQRKDGSSSYNWPGEATTSSFIKSSHKGIALL